MLVVVVVVLLVVVVVLVVVVLVVVVLVVVDSVVVVVCAGVDVVAAAGSMLPGTNNGASPSVSGTVAAPGSGAWAVDVLFEEAHPAINVAMVVAVAIPMTRGRGLTGS